jgi:undecaprenyl-phosphate 4-deoxy-4-formamido-L-arabinose transferase
MEFDKNVSTQAVQFSVIVPVYNGENTVDPLFERLRKYFTENKFSFEVIFVFDCGKDNSWGALMELKRKYSDNIILVKLSRNFGQHNALICGFEYASGEFFITMDEDLQHSPEDITLLFQNQIKHGSDVVYGKYNVRKHSFIRNSGSKFLNKIISVGIPDIHPDYSSFRLIKSSIARSTINMKNSYTFLDGYLSWVTTNISSEYVHHSKRQAGESAYTLNKLINHTINIVITFSDYPVRMISKFSVVLIFCMFFFTIYIFLRKYLLNDFAIGFPTLILSIGYGVGLILLALGIIGEYIFRINLKTTRRPNYFVDKVIK